MIDSGCQIAFPSRKGDIRDPTGNPAISSTSECNERVEREHDALHRFNVVNICNSANPLVETLSSLVALHHIWLAMLSVEDARWADTSKDLSSIHRL